MNSESTQGSSWIKLGEYVDAKDRHNDWQAGLVIYESNNQVKVRFDGWASKFDEVFLCNSQKLKPFRTMTKGYTGQKKSPGIRDHWEFSMENHSQRIDKLNDFIANLTEKSTHQIVQYLRGEHYFYIDFLMTVTYSEQSQIQSVYHYFKIHIELMKKYLAEFSKRDMHLYSDQEQKSFRKVFFDCHHQITDAFHTITGGNIRLKCFYKNNQKLIQKYISPDQNEEMFMAKMIVNSQVLIFLQKFMAQLMVESKVNVPISFYRSVFEIFNTLQKVPIGKQINQKLLRTILQIIVQRFARLSVADVKKYQKQIQDILNTMKLTYFRSSDKQKVNKWVQEAKLSYWSLLVECDVLEKKLKGINKIKQFIDSINSNFQYGRVMHSPNEIKTWFYSKDIYNTIFQKNQHSQVIRKGCDLIMVLYTERLCNFTIFENIWVLCSDKHQAIRSVLFQFWVQLIQVVRKDDEPKLYKIISKQTINITQNDQIQHLFKFLHNIRPDDVDTVHVKNFIIVLFEKVIQNQRFLPNFTKQISQFEGDAAIIEQIIESCLNNISHRYQSHFHLTMLAQIYIQYASYKVYIPQKIISILINQLSQIVQRQQNQEQVRTIFQIFNSIMASKESQVNLRNEQFLQIWTIFQKVPATSISKQIFYSWIILRTKHNGFQNPTYSINNKMNLNLKMYIFKSILCNPSKLDYANISLNEFMIFKEFMIYANAQYGNLQVRNHFSPPKKIIKVKCKDIYGLQRLQQIFWMNQNQESIEAISHFIKDLYMKNSSAIPLIQRQERINDLMKQIDIQLKSSLAKQDILLTKKCIQILIKIIAEVKQIFQHPTYYGHAYRDIKTIIRVYKDEKQYKQFSIYVDELFINIKRDIANAFELQMEDFTLYSGKAQVQKDHYDMPYCQHKFQDKVFTLLQINSAVEKSVLHYITSHMQEQFVELLKNSNVSQQAYSILSYLEITHPKQLFEQLVSFIDKNSQGTHSVNSKIYLHTYFLKVFSALSKSQNTSQLVKVYESLVSNFKIQVDHSISTSYLLSLVDLFSSVNKNQDLWNRIIESKSKELRDSLFELFINIVSKVNSQQAKLNQINNQQKLFHKGILLYTATFSNTKELFNDFVGRKQFQQLIIELYSNNQSNNIKPYLEKKLASWAKNKIDSLERQQELLNFLFKNVYETIVLTKNPFQTEVLFIFKIYKTFLENFSQQTFKKLSQGKQGQNNSSFLDSIMNKISGLSDTIVKTNFSLMGHLMILNSICIRSRSCINKELVDFLLYECLYYVDDKTKGADTKCLTPETIEIVLQLLLNVIVQRQVESENDHQSLQSGRVVVSINQEFGANILRFLKQFHYIEHWRNSLYWHTEPSNQLKSKSGYVGLENPGCICYLNSLLQQLFMIQQFRYSLIAVNTKENTTINRQGEETVDKKNLDSPQLIQKLKQLFISLMLSDNSAINPRFFTDSIRTAADKPMVKIFQQMDIDQFSMILFDKIENRLQALEQPNFVRNLFGGYYSNEIISKQCNHSSEREQQFLSISLDVRKNIRESFQSLVKGEMLEGQNAYFCQRCDKKVKALKRLSIKRLPPHLIISLRRFQFDFEIDAKTKINRYCQFPKKLNLIDYSQHKLNQNLKRKKRESEDEQDQQSQTFGDDYFIYKLKGVVVHSGSADSGHYYSFIEGEQGNWFEFNDEKVSQFDPDNLQEEAFGGKQGQYTRIKNAYLLFYERVRNTNSILIQPNIQKVQKERAANLKQQDILLPQLDRQISLQNLKQYAFNDPSNKVLIDNIKNQNKKIRKFHLIFNKEYQNFTLNLRNIFLSSIGISEQIHSKLYATVQKAKFSLCKPLKVKQNNQINQFYNQFAQYYISYVFLICLRKTNYFAILQMFVGLREILEQDQTLLNEVLSQMSTELFISQFIIDCTVRQKSKIVANFMYEMFDYYLNFQQIKMKRNNQEIHLSETLTTFLDICLRYCIDKAFNIAQLCSIIRKLINRQNDTFKEALFNYLMEKDILNIFIDNIFNLRFNKDEKQKKLARFQINQQQNTQMESSKMQIDSDISANDNDSSNDNSVQEISNKRQKTQLFGYYTKKTKENIIINDKQAWNIIYVFYKMIKEAKIKKYNEENRQHDQAEKDISEPKTILEKFQDQIDRFELCLVKIKQDKLMKVISEAKQTKSIMAMCRFLCLLAFAEKNYTDTFLNSIQKAFKDYESMKFRPFFLLLEQLLKIQDNLSSNRRVKILDLIIRSFKVNEKYFIECDFFQQWCLRFCKLVPQFFELIVQRHKIGNYFLTQMTNWIASKKSPGVQTLKKHRLITCQRLTQRYHNIVVSSESIQYEKLSLKKIKAFENLKNGRQPWQIDYTDQPQSDQLYLPNDKIYYFQSVVWIEGIVEENNFGIITCVFKTEKNKQEKLHIWQDEEKLKLAHQKKPVKEQEVINLENDKMQVQN